MYMTRHAAARQQKKAIPPLIINWLCEFGCRRRGMNGTTVIYFDKESKRSLCTEAGQMVIRRLGDMLDAYLVMSEGRIITVGHHFKPLKHR
ncbi:MAG: hypothetical protein OQK78_09365 [Gammaproteobacteria bacterium]|nr:hypothetical protein [Gammaproteobacteria bacterium]MCW8888370.1 hypothetical protein [Gammaproteobacteria bacterium]